MRLLLQALHAREAGFFRCTADPRVPPTSNQAGRGLRPSGIQDKTSGRLTGLPRTADRRTVPAALSSAREHLARPRTVLADAFRGTTGSRPPPKPDAPHPRRRPRQRAVPGGPGPNPPNTAPACGDDPRPPEY